MTNVLGIKAADGGQTAALLAASSTEASPGYALA